MRTSADFRLECRNGASGLEIHDSDAGISQEGTTVTFAGSDESGGETATLDLNGFGAAFEYGEYVSRLVIGSEDPILGECRVAP